MHNEIKENLIILGIVLPFFLLFFSSQNSLFAVSQNLENEKVIISFHDEADFKSIVSEFGLTDLNPVFFGHKDFSKIYSTTVSTAQFKKLQKDTRIKYAELNNKIYASVITANDTFFTTNDREENNQWYLAKIRISEAWEFTKGEGVKVAVIDTGIHAGHIELNDGRVIDGYDSINGTVILANRNSDDNGHGTAVAGVIGAIPNNSKGIAGINWNVRLMPVKALDSQGTGLVGAVANGIVWAVDNEADIINLSLGGPGFAANQTLNNAIRYAYDNDVLIVAAAGNDLVEQGSNLDTNPVFPICSDQGKNMILGVAATDINDRKAEFSNFSINCVDVSAPGKKILTTAFIPSDPADNILIYGSGTSLATPIVSGVAALIKSKNLNLSSVQIRDKILGSTDDIYPFNQTNCLQTSCNGFLGTGRINALKALTPVPISEGSLVRETGTKKIYLVTGGVKRLVTDFVFAQRGFNLADVRLDSNNDLASFITGLVLPPLEGTLIKAEDDPTVYIIHNEVKRALTFLVFSSRDFSFADVKSIPSSEVQQYPTGDWYWPPDGTMVLVSGDPTVYVMDQEVRRPITFFVFTQRKLSFAKVINVTLDEFSHILSSGDIYWMAPLDGTLVKSVSNPTVYIIENGTKRGLTGTAFANRSLNFSLIKSLPQVEIDVIKPGLAIIN
jgi:hypothetical protein